MISRRRFLQLSTATGASLLLPWRGNALQRLPDERAPRILTSPVPGGTLDPTSVPKYVTPLVIPPAMPRTSIIPVAGGPDIDYYEIAIRQFQQHILPTSMGLPTTVWSYGSVNHPGTFNFPAFTIEARNGTPVRVKWISQLVDTNGNSLPHLLPVDPTLHWANPAGPVDTRPVFTSTPGRYTGPVPMVTHLHGGHSTEESDGYAEAWYLPAAKNLAGYAPSGSWYNRFKGQFAAKFGAQWAPGSATFQYDNDQRAATLWYHDHSLGITRLNVYAGPAGFYILRGGPTDLSGGALPGPAPALDDAPGVQYYEIPIVIQDRALNSDGSLFYPGSRAFFGDVSETDKFIPHTEMSPIWNPEVFGNVMVVNGKSWPYLNVESAAAAAAAPLSLPLAQRRPGPDVDPEAGHWQAGDQALDPCPTLLADRHRRWLPARAAAAPPAADGQRRA